MSANHIANLKKRTKHLLKRQTGKRDVDKKIEDHFRTRTRVTTL